MADENFQVSYRCWNCNTPLVKSNGKRGLIKSQVLFFENNRLISKCKQCKENNVLPMVIQSNDRQPKLTVPIKKTILHKGLVKKKKVSIIKSGSENLYSKGKGSGKLLERRKLEK